MTEHMILTEKIATARRLEAFYLGQSRSNTATARGRMIFLKDSIRYGREAAALEAAQDALAAPAELVG